MANIPFLETAEAYKEHFKYVKSKELDTCIFESYNIFFIWNSTEKMIILYSAEWAEQCNQILAVMEQLSKQDAYKSIKFINVAIEEIPEVAQAHEIEAVPTVS